MKTNATVKRFLGRWPPCIAACTALFGANAEAATQGIAGATSSGSITITLSVAKRVQISGLSDVTFAEVSPETTATSSQSLCVWSNTATKGYSVTASGSGPGSSFELGNGSQATPYSVAWSDAAGKPSGMALDSGAALTGLASSASDPTCASGLTSSLIVTVDAADLQGLVHETKYSGALNLLVTPE